MTRPDAIGGYFSHELPTGGGQRYPTALPFQSAHPFQSARAAFLALLRKGRPNRVWMPWFICDSMIDPLRMANIPVERYAIDSEFRIMPDVTVQAGDWLLYVNYFGLSSAGVEDVLRRFPPQHVIIDCAQAFFAHPRDCLATLYSPRKFVGVADGGFLVTKRDLEQPRDMDDGSVDRSRHLLLRAAAGAEAGYASFIQAEKSLIGQEPKRMSELTEKLLSDINYEAISLRRRENFTFLQDALQSSNLMQPQLAPDDIPLCYPYRTNSALLRSKLINNRIFVPTYWPDVMQNGSTAPALEQDLARSILPLPCDQRYDKADMMRILNMIQQTDMKS